MTISHDKVAIITGGNSGIGRATALAIAKQGTKVVIAARRKRESEETVEYINTHGGHAIFIKTDVSDENDVSNLVNATIKEFGKLDYAFNNAGISGQGAPSTIEMPQTYWDEIIAINLTGVWLCMKYEIQVMLRQGFGSIVNNSSTSGLIGDLSTSAAYTASKHAVIGLTKHVALEYASVGIRVNAICPAWIDTAMVADTPGGIDQTVMDLHPVRRIGTPVEAAEAAIWLLSDAASFVTGHALPVDGGYLAK